MVDNSLIISINGNKANAFDASALPAEAMNLLSMMQAVNVSSTIKEDKINIKETSIGLNEIVQKVINAAESKPEVGLVRAQPQELKALQDKRLAVELLKVEVDPIKKLTIFESGVALGIVTGQTTKKEVIDIMKNYSKFNFTENDYIHEYSDIAVSVFFSDEGYVSEMKFTDRYRGKTSKGLGINDHVSKAIELYGQPKMKSPKGAIWDKFAVFCDKEIIISIRIQK
ncbi:MAG: hypothetical protein U0457_21885 [Candidatus Sericytochromatia bacterium]